MPSNRDIYFELLKKNNEYLNKSAIVTLLMDASGFTDRMAFYNHFNDEVKNPAKLQQNAEKVENGEPLQYVLGYAYFLGDQYTVNSDVLIPISLYIVLSEIDFIGVLGDSLFIK